MLGGKGANQAVGMARLGMHVSLIAAVGDDEIGARLSRRRWPWPMRRRPTFSTTTAP
jgi:sugar/nucleoside kinase (ribokinase family)